MTTAPESGKDRPYVTTNNVTKNWRAWCEEKGYGLINRTSPISGKVYSRLGLDVNDDKGHVFGLKEKQEGSF